MSDIVAVETLPDTEGAVRTWLRAQPSVAALVQTRIFLGGPPDKATVTPFLVINLLDGIDDESEAPVDDAQLSIDVWGDKAKEGPTGKASLAAVVRALRAVFRGIRSPVLLDAHTRCLGATTDLSVWQPDPNGVARYVMHVSVLTHAV